MSPNNDGITRRDFLDGAAITAAGLAAAAAAPHLTGAEAAAVAAGHGAPGLPPGYYPPAKTGLKGQPDRVVRQIMKIDGRPNPEDVHSARPGPGIDVRRVVDTHETYDCVIVGAGISGLAAAKYYRDRFGEDAKILLLDPLPDVGGHATRNEFHVPNAAAGGADLTLLRNGGVVNLDSVGTWNQPAGGLFDIPGSYGQHALDMLAYLGVEPDSFPENVTNSIPDTYGLRSMYLFPREDWGSDSLVESQGDEESWADFLARTPLSPEARAGIERIETDTTSDWITLRDGPKTELEKKQLLSPDHAEAVLHGLHRRARGGDRLVPAQRRTACSAPEPRRCRRPTCGRSVTPATRASASPTRASPASAAPRSSACSRTSVPPPRGPTATPRWCACSWTS